MKALALFLFVWLGSSVIAIIAYAMGAAHTRRERALKESLGRLFR